MIYRYKILMDESRDGDSSLATGMIVLPIDSSLRCMPVSADEAERTLREGVNAGKLGGGRIYQICPGIRNPEKIRPVAIGSEVMRGP